MRANLSRVVGPVLMFAAVSLLPRPVAAQTVTVVGPERVTVRAQNVPIATLLAELAPLASMDRMEVDPVDESRPVTFAVDNVPARVAILIALRSSGVDFIFTEKRLRVGAGGKVVETPRRTPATATHDTHQVPREPMPAAPPAARDQRGDRREGEDDPRTAAATAAREGVSAGGPVVQAEAASGTAASTISEFDHGLSVRDVPFVVKEDSVVVTEPGFVPYKNRPEVRRLRMTIDPASIP